MAVAIAATSLAGQAESPALAAGDPSDRPATDSAEKASAVLDRLLKTAESLAALLNRGAYVKELADLGIKEYRQVAFKPYRIIYRVTGSCVNVYLITDGRRNMQSHLVRRLVRG